MHWGLKSYADMTETKNLENIILLEIKDPTSANEFFISIGDDIIGLLPIKDKTHEDYHDKHSITNQIYKPCVFKERWDQRKGDVKSWAIEDHILLGYVFLSQVTTTTEIEGWSKICRISNYSTQIKLHGLFQSNSSISSNKFDVNIANSGCSLDRPLYPLFKLIKLINDFFNDGYLQESFDEKKLINYKANSKIDDDSWLKIINDFNYKQYENGYSRVGKDDVFWDEIEITNIPNNFYLIDHIIECIRKHVYDVRDVVFEKNKIITKYNQHYAYSPAPRERILSKNQPPKELFNSQILLNIKEGFDHKKYAYTSICKSFEKSD